MSIPTVRLYLDKRRVVSDNLAPVKIALCRKGKVAYINTQVRVKPSQWDAKAGKVIRHPFKTALTDSLHSKLMQVDGFLAQLSGQGRLANKTIVQIKDEIEDCIRRGGVRAVPASCAARWALGGVCRPQF